MYNRVLSRTLHLVSAVALAAFIYSPLRSNSTFEMVMSYGVFPFLALTGMWMWQAPRLRRFFRSHNDSEKKANISTS